MWTRKFAQAKQGNRFPPYLVFIIFQQSVSPSQYQKLLALGFRPSTLLLDPDCVYDVTCHRAYSTHAPRSRKESPQKPDAPSGIAARGAVDPQM
ncbi:hypothetical protein DPMN_003374 [Dreissena polymorpha]|uniref:Uncharacterized protein n=1 Tax=Dreissena polymorpha TaxID=45954 RepID=A0A9D4MNB2_DREPO|nr:hypothetical protein DPMN_003374 [Dreissena polymorpha]